MFCRFKDWRRVATRFARNVKNFIAAIAIAATAIIPFKARTWIDLTRQQQSGAKVDAKDIKKHRNVLQLLSPETRTKPPAVVAEDMLTFLEMLSGDAVTCTDR